MFDEIGLSIITNENNLDMLTDNLFVLDDGSDFCVAIDDMLIVVKEFVFSKVK